MGFARVARHDHEPVGSLSKRTNFEKKKIILGSRNSNEQVTINWISRWLYFTPSSERP